MPGRDGVARDVDGISCLLGCFADVLAVDRFPPAGENRSRVTAESSGATARLPLSRLGLFHVLGQSFDR